MSARLVKPARPPPMMLALLIHCYATGRFGSRTIEAATHSDVAVRYLCANHHPDHDSIGVFRTANRAAFPAAFVTGLQLAQQLRLTRVGTVSVDGTKLQANASKHAAVSYQRAGELIQQLQLEVQELVARAEPADTREAKETLDIPAELTRRESRMEALKQARQGIEARAKIPPPQAPDRAPPPAPKSCFRQPQWFTPVDLAKIFFQARQAASGAASSCRTIAILPGPCGKRYLGCTSPNIKSPPRFSGAAIRLFAMSHFTSTPAGAGRRP